MARTLTYVIELAVGLACLVGAVAAWRRRRRWLGVALAVAGCAAAVHAVAALA